MSDLADKMKCIDELMQENRLLGNEVATLKAELKLKDEKLSEYENGIPIEKADKEKRYWGYCNGQLRFFEWPKQATRWITLGCEICGDNYIPSGTVVYPLPSQNSQTQEGS